MISDKSTGLFLLVFFTASVIARAVSCTLRGGVATCEQEESTDDREVFEELRHLHLASVATPLSVEEERRDSREDNEHPGCSARLVVKEEHEATPELKNDSNYRCNKSNAR